MGLFIYYLLLLLFLHFQFRTISKIMNIHMRHCDCYFFIMVYLSILAISIHGEISLICSNYFDLISKLLEIFNWYLSCAYYNLVVDYRPPKNFNF